MTMPRGKYGLLEVFSIRVNNDDDLEAPADIIGEICITEGCRSPTGSFKIFSRKKGDYESFLPGTDTELLLTGPPASHQLRPTEDGFAFCLSLFDYLPEDDDDEEEEEEKNQLYSPYSAVDVYTSQVLDLNKDFDRGDFGPNWNHYSWGLGCQLDTIRSKTFYGEYGSVTVRFIVFNVAIEAILEMRLLPRSISLSNVGVDRSSDYNLVSGRLTAHSTMIVNEKILLFRSRMGKHVKHGEIIPLSRSLLALPLKSSLVIEADLSVTNGTVEFPVPEWSTFIYSSTSSEKLIKGRRDSDHDILVRVTFTW